MKVHARVFGVLFCAGFLIGSVGVFAQEKKPGDKPADTKSAAPADKKPAAAAGAAGHPSPEDMAKMMQLAAPGPEHAKLKQLTGKWTFVTKHRMSPDQPWEEAPGKAEYKWILGGRVLTHEVKSDPNPKDPIMGGFEGFGLTGYDNMTKKYWNTWADNMGTAVMLSTGTADSSGKTFTYSGEYDCPMTGQRKTAKSVLKIAGDDKVVFEMYDKDPAGKEYMMLEVTYARAK